MSSTKVRTQVLLPKDLLDDIDALVGEANRSKYIEELVEDHLRINRSQLEAIRRVKATPPPPLREAESEPLDEQERRERLLRITDRIDATPPPPGDPPEWATPEGVAKWVHDLRREESSRTRRIEELLHEDTG